MSILKVIKNFFKKELTSILAPLEKIHTQLNKFIDHTEVEIADNVKKISDLVDTNKLHELERDSAAKVKENIKALLGKF